MNCNPDIKRVECWMCQRNPYVQRVPLTVAGGNPSPGHPVPLKIDRDECEVIAALGGIAGEPGLADPQMILGMLSPLYNGETGNENLEKIRKAMENASGGPGTPASPDNPICAEDPEDNKEPKGVHINVYLF